MRDFLILRLKGPMQSWGQPTFEGYRPSAAFPTRSGLLGLLGACLGIRREDKSAQQQLSDSVRFAIRCDSYEMDGKPVATSKLIDFHTVKDARQSYSGLKSHETIITRREYLCDASFTVAVWLSEQASLTLEQLQQAVKKPIFTPFLGRKSCPLTHPLWLDEVRAQNSLEALNFCPPGGSAIYSEEEVGDNPDKFFVRDEPIINLPRQFASRHWYVMKGDAYVSQ